MPRYGTIHLATGPRPEGSNRQPILCKASDWYPSCTDDPAMVNCPSCLSVLQRRALASRSPELPALALVKVERPPYGYRFAYEAHVGGEHVGYVVYEGAYGRAHWHVCVIDPERPGNPVGYKLMDDPEKRYPTELRYATKEAALMACEGLRAAGRLWTRAERVQQLAEAHARFEENKRRAAAEAVQREEKRKLTLEGLRSIQESCALTNLQAAALADAITELETHEP